MEDELLRRLRSEAGYRALPMLDPNGYYIGLHLHRFLPGQVLDIVQIWTEQFGYVTVRAQLENSFNAEVPFAPPAAIGRDRGTLVEIADRLLPLGKPPPGASDWPQ